MNIELSESFRKLKSAPTSCDGINLTLPWPSGGFSIRSKAECIDSLERILRNSQKSIYDPTLESSGILDCIVLQELLLGRLGLSFEGAFGGREMSAIISSLRNAKSVYFIRCKHSGRIKIGMSEKVLQRLSSLQASSPTELEIIHAECHSHKLESKIHDHLSKFRLHGEWFSSNVEVESFAYSLKELGLPWAAEELNRGKQ